MKVTSNSTHCKKAQKNKKTGFQKNRYKCRLVYTRVLNKIMTTHKQCTKHNFVAPLTSTFLALALIVSIQSASMSSLLVLKSFLPLYVTLL